MSPSCRRTSDTHPSSERHQRDLIINGFAVAHPPETAPPQRARRARVFRYAQWVVAVGLLCWLGFRHREAFQAIRGAALNVPLVAAAVGCAFLAQLAMGFRWYCLMPPLAAVVPATVVCRTTFLAALSNYSPLGDYGGMTFRVAFLMRRGCPRMADAVLSVVLDRVIGLTCLVVMSWVAISLLRISSHRESASALRTFQHITMAGLAGVTAIYALTCLRGLRNSRLVRKPRQFVAWNLGRLVQQRRQVALAAGCSIVSQAFAVLALACAAAAIARGQQVPDLMQHAAILPVVELSALVLPTPSGIGVREFALSQLYHDAMPDATISAAGRLGFLVAIALRLAAFVSTLLGILGLSILNHRRQPFPPIARRPAGDDDPSRAEYGRTGPTQGNAASCLPQRPSTRELQP